MVLHQRLARLIGKATIACSLLASCSLWAADKAVEGEILKITNGRTGFMIDLAGDLALADGATIKMTVGGKERTGTVKKVTDNGNAFIRLNKGLPKSVGVGDRVALEVETGAMASAEEKPGSVQLQKGGYSKAYWDEVSYLAAHRNPGVRADLELSLLSAAGNDKSTGGTAANGTAIGDDTEFAVTDKHTKFAGDVGYVGRSGLGGGVILNYDSSARDATASIQTASTSTTDHDENKTDRKVTEFKPYGQVQSRVKTGDVGFGVGLGIPIRSTTAEEKVAIAGAGNDSQPAKTNEAGVSLEALIGSNRWAFIVGLTPSLSGKIKQTGEDDITHKSSEYGFHFETYGQRMKSRIGLILYSSKDDYRVDALKETATKLSGRLDLDMGSVNLVPFLDYTTSKRTAGDRKGTFSDTDIGTRVAKAGRYAPFLSLSLDLKNGKETLADGRDVTSKVSGLRFAGGLNI